jgi:hypothetical protein
MKRDREIEMDEEREIAMDIDKRSSYTEIEREK